MPRKYHTPERLIDKPREAEVELSRRMRGELSITQLLPGEHINKMQYEMNESQAIERLVISPARAYLHYPESSSQAWLLQPRLKARSG